MDKEPFKNPLLRRTIPSNGIDASAVQRFRMKRVPTPARPSPYLPLELRKRFAAETMRSIKASPAEQAIELELMLLDEED